MADLKARSRAMWRRKGYHVENAEHYNAHSRRKEDLYGFVDLIALPLDGATVDGKLVYPGTVPPTVYIQSTSWGHVTTRLRKIQTESTGRGQWRVEIRRLARALLLSGARIMIEGWRKRDGRYECRTKEVTLEDLS